MSLKKTMMNDDDDDDELSRGSIIVFIKRIQKNLERVQIPKE